MALHFFCTSGSVGGVNPVAPKATEIDTGTTVTGTALTTVFLTSFKNMTLVRMIVLKFPTVSVDTVTITDKAGNTLTSFQVPLSSAPLYEFGSIPIPQQGFFIATTNAAAAYCFVFDASGSIAS